MAGEAGYLLDNQQVEAGQRLDALSALFDPSTRRHLTAVGLAAGWRVWEVGAGCPAVALWLTGQVGPQGRVLATDIDTGRLDGATGYEVLRHDVGLDPPPEGLFGRSRPAGARPRAAARPGARRHDCRAPAGRVAGPGRGRPGLAAAGLPRRAGPAQQLANRLKIGFRHLLAQRGVDLAYGRTLPRRLRAAGLLDVAADAYFPITGAACQELERATIEQVRERLVAADIATTAEIDRHLSNVASGELDLATSPMITAWGRRPPTRLIRNSRQS